MNPATGVKYGKINVSSGFVAMNTSSVSSKPATSYIRGAMTTGKKKTLLRHWLLVRDCHPRDGLGNTPTQEVLDSYGYPGPSSDLMYICLHDRILT